MFFLFFYFFLPFSLRISLSAIALGGVLPLFTILFGSLFNIFATQTPDQIRSSSSIIAAIFVGYAQNLFVALISHDRANSLAVYNLVFGYLGSMFWGLVGEAAGMYLRAEFFQSLMKQEVGFFESERQTKQHQQTFQFFLD